MAAMAFGKSRYGSFCHPGAGRRPEPGIHCALVACRGRRGRKIKMDPGSPLRGVQDEERGAWLGMGRSYRRCDVWPGFQRR